VRNLFHVFWQLNKSNIFCQFHWSCANVPLQIPGFRKCHHGRWNLSLWLWSWDQGSEFSVEITQFSSCKKSASINIQHQGDDDCCGIVRAEFVPRNTTVKAEYFKVLLERLRNDVRRKRPEKWANGFILHHDNPPCHTSLLVRQFLSNKNITLCPHPL